MREIDVYQCVVSGDGYIAGEIYPGVGLNNGVQLAKTTPIGDCETSLFFNIGESLLPADGESKKPRFVHLCSVMPPYFPLDEQPWRGLYEKEEKDEQN